MTKTPMVEVETPKHILFNGAEVHFTSEEVNKQDWTNFRLNSNKQEKISLGYFTVKELEIMRDVALGTKIVFDGGKDTEARIKRLRNGDFVITTKDLISSHKEYFNKFVRWSLPNDRFLFALSLSNITSNTRTDFDSVVSEQKEAEDDAHEASVAARTDIVATTKKQLINARSGQGVFRTNVLGMEHHRCRITGEDNEKHLRASHIKPWRSCSDEEKLNGENGLALAPHVDHLFDKGYISFSDDGYLMTSKELNIETLHRWGINEKINVGTFSRSQILFIEYHRENVFLG